MPELQLHILVVFGIKSMLVNVTLGSVAAIHVSCRLALRAADGSVECVQQLPCLRHNTPHHYVHLGKFDVINIVYMYESMRKTSNAIAICACSTERAEHSLCICNCCLSDDVIIATCKVFVAGVPRCQVRQHVLAHCSRLCHHINPQHLHRHLRGQPRHRAQVSTCSRILQIS